MHHKLDQAMINSDRIHLFLQWSTVLFCHCLGSLKVDIRSADGLRVPLRIDQQGQIYSLHFTATREGKYDLTISYDGNPLPNMPIRAIANSASFNASEHLKVEVHGRGSYEGKVNEDAEFTIDASKALIASNGMPVVRLTGVQTDIEVRIRQIEQNIFRCSYVPTIAGRQQQNTKRK
jgi:hypothetical protein